MGEPAEQGRNPGRIALPNADIGEIHHDVGTERIRPDGFTRRPAMTGTVHLSSAAGPSGRGQGPARGLFARLGRIVTAHPAKVALGWLLVVGTLIAVSSALGQPPPSSSEASQLPADYESARAQAAIDMAFGAPSSDAMAVLVVSRADSRPLTPGNLAAADHAVAVLTGMEARHRAAGPQRARPAPVRVSPGVQVSPNHLVALAPVSFAAQSGTPATGQAVVN